MMALHGTYMRALHSTYASPRGKAAFDSTILDRAVNLRNFAVFERCSLLEGGRAIRFRYPSGDTYRVAIEYVLSWFNGPHQHPVAGRAVDVKEGERRALWPPDPAPAAVRCRRLREGSVLLVVLEGGESVEVAWDTVLMACEPNYEHFGGLTACSRALTKSGFDRWQPIHSKRGTRGRRALG